MSASPQAARVRPGALAPELRRALSGLDELTAQFATTAGVEAGFSHLLRLRAA